MSDIARLGDRIEGGAHCHGGHNHPPPATPGQIIEGSKKVFVRGQPVARAGDRGHSDRCCAGIGDIVVMVSQQKVFVDGSPAASRGTPTVHCGMASGKVASGESSVQIP